MACNPVESHEMPSKVDIDEEDRRIVYFVFELEIFDDMRTRPLSPTGRLFTVQV